MKTLRKLSPKCQFFEMKYGNKREERAACDFLNEVQRYALLAASASKRRPALPPSSASACSN